MAWKPPFIVRTGIDGAGDEPVETLEEAIACASDCIDGAVDPVDIVDANGCLVYDQGELVGKVIEYRQQRGELLESLRRKGR